MKIVVALDSFKGSLTAREACERVVAGLQAAHPEWRIESRPMADGGEGTVSVLLSAAGGEWCTGGRVAGPLPGMLLQAGFGWLPESRTAIVEMASASGLALLSRSQRNPLLTTTLGTGQLMAAAIGRGARKVLLTLGGSATVDGGTGAARALGWKFLDRRGWPVPPGGGFIRRIRRLVPPPGPFPEIEVLCDVQNPLCGPQGAARVFGPQKGATPAMVRSLEAGLYHLADLVRRQLGKEILHLPGGGAAGGFGAGAVAFCGARLVAGAEAVAKTVGLAEALEGADWVITGEGTFDGQSFQGKVVGGVRDAARKKGVKVAVLAGRVKLSQDRWRREDIDQVEAAAGENIKESRALAEAGPLLSEAAARLSAVLE